VFVVGGDGPALEALGLRVVPDRWPGEGPLGGLVTALEAATHDVVVILSCDLPRVTGEAVQALLDGIAGHDAAGPVVGGRRQHLMAAWRRERALAPLAAAFAAGERAIWRACGTLSVANVTLRDDSWARDADDADELFRAGPGG
jgi:molybdopterin-guanine dinucleotide biosynthesis protein A